MLANKTLLDVFRLGLKGDSSSFRRLAKKLLREADLDEDLRTGVASLLAVAPDKPPLRWAQPELTGPASRLLVTSEPGDEQEAPVFGESVSSALEQVIRERARQADLDVVGLVPTRTLLLTGPPGVGKTMAACYIASRLALPLHRVDLSALLSSFLGRTGQNLRSALLGARESPCVLLLDEFDAIAKRRDDPADVGELKRIVNVLLLELDEWPATSLFIAATNHPELLDRAVWRRFERVVEIPAPDATVRRAIVLRQLERHGMRSDVATVDVVVAATQGRSGSDLVTLVRSAIRMSVIGNRADCGPDLIGEALNQLANRATEDAEARVLYCRVAHERMGATQREIADRLGLSHVTVGRMLKSTVGRKERREPAARGE